VKIKRSRKGGTAESGGTCEGGPNFSVPSRLFFADIGGAHLNVRKGWAECWAGSTGGAAHRALRGASDQERTLRSEGMAPLWLMGGRPEVSGFLPLVVRPAGTSAGGGGMETTGNKNH